ncbi:MAG: DEAD/DEAH box helicase [Aureliella sp.]
MATAKSPRSTKKSQGQTANPKSKLSANLHRVTKRLSLRDRLSQLTYRAACRLLGQDGESLLRRSGEFDLSPAAHLKLFDDTLVATVPDASLPGQIARVTLVEKTSRSGGLQMNCDQCGTTCLHGAAALAAVLENKLALGLSEAPDLREPIENLTEKELILRALGERQLRATSERMKIKAFDRTTPWSDYSVTSLESGKTYRVALRGTEPGESYCSCPDFRTNHLGTCKHILAIVHKLPKRFSKKELAQPYVRQNFSLRVDYAEPMGLRFNLPTKIPEAVASLCKPLAGRTFTDVSQCVAAVRKLERAGASVHIYPDAEEFIALRSLQARLEKFSQAIRSDPTNHPLRKQLLKVELLPYQLDGIAFAVGAGRAVLADDMGLGKTIQGIGTAELFAQLAEIRRVLVVCPASLKSQWAAEIARFSNRTHQIVLGSAHERATQYRNDAFFTIANYEQVVRDEASVGAVDWDLIILDEGQRIKNWESKTSRTFKSLKSRFALVLSGTPLENRLEELFTVVSFVDSHSLGPAYRFFHRHRVVDDEGRVKGYRQLDELRERLKPILLRRTRESVKLQLPERTTEIIRIRPTEEQERLSEANVARAAQIAAKKFITEMDLLMIQKYLLTARMAADSTYLCDKQKPGFSSKLETLDELLDQLADEQSRKIVLFSEWTTMLDLIEPLLRKHGIGFVRLDGGVPQKQRQQLVLRFQNDPTCRCIIMTNAGATGLNLQSANTVINVDLPWNPAILEQRIARAHRMGQKNPVQVFLLVTEGTIEERLLSTLANKQELALAALDVESDVSEVLLENGMEALKRRLEKLLGNKPTAAIDQSQREEVLDQTREVASQRERVASASGELLGAALNLVAQLVDGASAAPPETVAAISQNLTRCVDRDESGRPQLKVTLPSDEALNTLAQTLAKLLVQAQ